VAVVVVVAMVVVAVVDDLGGVGMSQGMHVVGRCS
jgi:hypothetical protein